jgi:flagellar export protein FliJ
MPFRFPLEAVLHFRQSQERQQELRFRSLNQQVAGMRHLIEQADERIRHAQALARKELETGTTAAEMRFAVDGTFSLRQLRQDMERERVRLQHLCDQQRKVLQQARRERETYENLREQQRQEYDRNLNRREQRQLDDLFLLRRSYLRSH